MTRCACSENMESIARTLIITGLILVGLGGLVFLLARSGLPIGRLPGDIRIQTSNVTCVFPIVTGLLLSIVLTILLNIIIRLINR
jgi:hypothetical protein